MSKYYLNYLDELESEAIYILREVWAQFQNPVILFSGGKDSILVTHLAKKAFYPSKIPFALMHALQITTLLDAIGRNKVDCAIGGGRRDEEKARAKERFFSHRDDFGQWDPKNQRPELWNILNGKYFEGEHFRAFPISNWTEMDVWNYIQRENIEIPSLYLAHEREVVRRQDSWIPNSDFLKLEENEEIVTKKIRFRTLGDITITGGIESDADTIEKVALEVSAMRQTERGNRSDDKRSETAMEDRKREGYF